MSEALRREQRERERRVREEESKTKRYNDYVWYLKSRAREPMGMFGWCMDVCCGVGEERRVVNQSECTKMGPCTTVGGGGVGLLAMAGVISDGSAPLRRVLRRDGGVLGMALKSRLRRALADDETGGGLDVAADGKLSEAKRASLRAMFLLRASSRAERTPVSVSVGSL